MNKQKDEITTYTAHDFQPNAINIQTKETNKPYPTYYQTLPKPTKFRRISTHFSTVTTNQYITPIIVDGLNPTKDSSPTPNTNP